MKQNPQTPETLTKRDLLDALAEFRKDLNKDFERIDKRFSDIDKRFSDIDKRFSDIDKKFDQMEIRFGLKLDELEFKIEDRAQQRHSEVLTRCDNWAGYIENAREDQTISSERLNDHEERITKLESTKN